MKEKFIDFKIILYLLNISSFCLKIERRQGLIWSHEAHFQNFFHERFTHRTLTVLHKNVISAAKSHSLASFFDCLRAF